jgi:hypothetical protein
LERPSREVEWSPKLAGHRRNVGIELIEQLEHFGYIADIIRRQVCGHDFMRDGSLLHGSGRLPSAERLA